MQTILQTIRLLVREMSEVDLPFIASMLAHPEVMTAWERTCDRGEAQEWIERQQDRYARDGFGYWLAIEQQDEKPIGQVGLLSVEVAGRQQVGLGYMIHRSFWKRGYASEGARACVDWGFHHLSCECIIALIRPANTDSIRVAERIGLKRSGSCRHGGFDHEVYEIKRSKNRPSHWEIDPPVDPVSN